MTAPYSVGDPDPTPDVGPHCAAPLPLLDRGSYRCTWSSGDAHPWHVAGGGGIVCATWPAADPAPAPGPPVTADLLLGVSPADDSGRRTYVVGLPVVLTVHPDGRVEAEVDLSEADCLDDRAGDWSSPGCPRCADRDDPAPLCNHCRSERHRDADADAVRLAVLNGTVTVT